MIDRKVEAVAGPFINLHLTQSGPEASRLPEITFARASQSGGDTRLGARITKAILPLLELPAEPDVHLSPKCSL
jgi:hypothetical protein